MPAVRCCCLESRCGLNHTPAHWSLALRSRPWLFESSSKSGFCGASSRVTTLTRAECALGWCHLCGEVNLPAAALGLLMSAPQSCYVDLVHLQHGFHHTLRFFRIGAAHQLH